MRKAGSRHIFSVKKQYRRYWVPCVSRSRRSHALSAVRATLRPLATAHGSTAAVRDSCPIELRDDEHRVSSSSGGDGCWRYRVRRRRHVRRMLGWARRMKSVSISVTKSPTGQASTSPQRLAPGRGCPSSAANPGHRLDLTHWLATGANSCQFC